jgi:hypothetical protein
LVVYNRSTDYPYLNVISDPAALFVNETFFGAVHSYLYNQVTDIEGIEGQGSADPSSIFNNHQFVEHSIGGVTNWYDPSYGVIYSGINEAGRLSSFQGALDGLYKIRQISVSEASIDFDLNDNGTKTDVLLLWCLLTKKKPSGTFIKRGDLTWTTP